MLSTRLPSRCAAIAWPACPPSPLCTLPRARGSYGPGRGRRGRGLVLWDPPRSGRRASVSLPAEASRLMGRLQARVLWDADGWGGGVGDTQLRAPRVHIPRGGVPGHAPGSAPCALWRQRGVLQGRRSFALRGWVAQQLLFRPRLTLNSSTSCLYPLNALIPDSSLHTQLYQLLGNKKEKERKRDRAWELRNANLVLRGI